MTSLSICYQSGTRMTRPLVPTIGIRRPRSGLDGPGTVIHAARQPTENDESPRAPHGTALAPVICEELLSQDLSFLDSIEVEKWVT